MTTTRLQADQLAPLFVLTALVHAAGVVSRFDVLTAQIPPILHGALLYATLPLILITGYFESRIDHGGPASFPLWMRIESRPLKWALTLGFTYLVILVVQTLDWTFGPLDPSPPLEWPLPMRAAWFLMFSFGMFFANLLATTGFLIPVLRVVTWPARLLPAPLAVLLLTAGGLGLAHLALDASASADQGGLLGDARALLSDPTTGVLATTALVLLPLVLGGLLGPLLRRRQPPR